MQTNLTLPFTFDGETLTKGNLQFSVKNCCVEGVNFCLPPKYGLLLLDDTYRVEAQRLLDELMNSPLTEDVKTSLVSQVCLDGFLDVWSLLEKYRQNMPTDEPKFYAEQRYGQLETRVIALVTLEKTLRFAVSSDLQPILPQLQPNVYKTTEIYSSFRLTLSKYQKLVGREREFFEFISELDQCFAYVRSNACASCFDKFFEDSKQAYILLKEIQKKVGSRVQRDELFLRLEREGVLEFSLGLFVYSGWSTFFVSENGHVARMCYNPKVAMREAVLRSYMKGILPPSDKLDEVKENYTLRRVAEIVKKVRPDLAFIILP